MLNHTIVQGRLTADPELRYTQSNTPVCSFTVAWSEKIKENEIKLFLNCVAWNGIAEMLCKNFRKGQAIIVEGKLHRHEWNNKEGQPRSSIELSVLNVHFCGPRQERGDIPPAAQAPAAFADFEEDSETIPF